MPTITDGRGTRRISEAELAEVRAEADAGFQAFWDALEWRPIAEYDRATAPDAIVDDTGDVERWAFAFWGTREPASGETAWGDDATPMWRDRQDSREGVPLDFEPRRFAFVSTDWARGLAAD